MKCETCGDLDMVLLDGYDVGDRVLEGVMFEIRRKPNGTYDAKVRAEDADYFNDLNTRKWLKAMREHAAETDIATCPKCGNDVAMNETASAKPSVEITRLSSFGDVIRAVLDKEKDKA